MTRTREGNASRGMIRPSRAMAIDVATLRHVFERIDANGDGDIDPKEFFRGVVGRSRDRATSHRRVRHRVFDGIDR